MPVDDEEDGRAIAGCLTELVGDVFAALRGRAEGLLGEIFVLGVIILLFLSDVDGVILIAEVRLTFRGGARCGRGLMGLEDLSMGDCSITDVPLPANPLSSFSSSVLVLSFLRVPARARVSVF
jgi:hypothetical protein